MIFSISNKKRSRQMSASVYSINKKAIVKDPSSKSQVLSLWFSVFIAIGIHSARTINTINAACFTQDGNSMPPMPAPNIITTAANIYAALQILYSLLTLIDGACFFVSIFLSLFPIFSITKISFLNENNIIVYHIMQIFCGYENKVYILPNYNPFFCKRATLSSISSPLSFNLKQ